jgi:ADP-heptose:LPS heptosyltransferase
VHALPAAGALRDAFPTARLDWVIDPKWARILEGNPDISEVVLVDCKSASSIATAVRGLRAAKYTCTIDFQVLFKSAILAYASGAPRRIGFHSSYAREGMAAAFYTECLKPRGAHKVEHNLTLVEHLGAQKTKPRFPMVVHPEEDDQIRLELATRNIGEFFVLNPGGGWLSKCWPAERYGELHRRLSARHGWRGIVSFGPGEEDLAQRVIVAAGNPPPIAILFGLGPLMALLRRANFIVTGDTGPLHLASALGRPVVGLFGPTDPSRNGPYSSEDVVVRNPRYSEPTYKRGKSYSAAMLSISVDQVFEAVERRLGLCK